MTTGASIQLTIKDDVLKALVKELNKVTTGAVDVGFLGGKRHEETPETTVAEIATIHEFGSDDGKIPARPFMQQTLKKHNNYIDLLKRESNRLLTGKQTNATMLVRMGETVRGDMVEEITTGTFAPLAASTIKAKGSSKPLIDTGFLRNSIEFRVVK